MHFQGLGGLDQDYKQAFDLYQRAADLRSMVAWQNLASMYVALGGCRLQPRRGRQSCMADRTVTGSLPPLPPSRCTRYALGHGVAKCEKTAKHIIDTLGDRFQ